jgi:hypothetical protein
LILGSALLIFLNTTIQAFNWILIFLVSGLGHGLLFSPLSLAAEATSDSEDPVSAASMFTFARGLGISVGVAMGGSIFQNSLGSYLLSARLPLKNASDAAALVLELWKTPVSLNHHLELVSAYAGASQIVFEVMAGVALLGGVVSLLIEPHSLDKESDTGHMLHRE